jgi:hypothetical protein
MTISSNRFLLFRFPNQNVVCISILCHTCTFFMYIIPLNCITLIHCSVSGKKFKICKCFSFPLSSAFPRILLISCYWHAETRTSTSLKCCYLNMKIIQTLTFKLYSSPISHTNIHQLIFTSCTPPKNLMDYLCSILVHFTKIYIGLHLQVGHAVAYLVEALCYKPECRGFDSR